MKDNIKKNKNYYYIKLINYIENHIPQEITNTFRDKILIGFLSKYVKTVKAIRILDLLGYFEECDILIRSLYEIVVEIAYLELDINKNYERLELYSYHENKKFIEQLSKEFKADINTILDYEKINLMADEYKNKKYDGSRNYWNGMSIRDTAKIVDKEWHDGKDFVSLEKLYFVIYKIDCLFSHNSVKILETNYINMIEKGLEYKISPFPNENYIHSCNAVYLISYNLVNKCLPEIFSVKTDIFYDFDSFIANKK